MSLHHLAEFHVGDVDHRPVVALADGDDLVVHLQLTALFGHAAGHQLLDHREAVLAHQRGPDPALEFQTHGDVEVLLRLGRHVAGVRVERRGEGVQIHLQQFCVVDLVHPPGEAAVSLRQLVLRLLALDLLVRLQRQQVVLDPLPPQVAGLGRVARILGRVVLFDDLLVNREIVLRGEQLVDRLDPLVDALQERAKHAVGKAHVAPADGIAQIVLMLHELVDVRLVKVDLHRVQPLQKLLQTTLRNLFVQRVAREVLPQQPGNRQGGIPITRTGSRRVAPRQRVKCRDHHHDQQPTATMTSQQEGPTTHSTTFEKLENLGKKRPPSRRRSTPV